MSIAAAIPSDASSPAESPDAGHYEHPTNDPQPPVGTMPTGPHAEAEAAALQAAHSGAELVALASAANSGQRDPRRPGTRGLIMFGSILTADQREVTPDAPPSCSTTSTGRVLAEMDTLIGDSLGQRNQALRRQLRDATGELARERALRQDVEARLAQVTSERDALAVKLAETERALNVVGAAIKHAIRHDEGGESDG